MLQKLYDKFVTHPKGFAIEGVKRQPSATL